MGKLQRPATLKEFVIQSLLGWRDPDPTLVDHEDESPTALLPRRPESSAPPPAGPRETLASYVFDLRVVPRVASSPSDPELLRDTLPAPPPAAPRRATPLRRRQVIAPVPAPAAPAPARSSALARLILLALLVLAALASAGTQPTGAGPAAVRALPHAR